MGLMHNKALWLTLMSGSSAAATVSGAGSLLANEADGLALDFTDSTWFSTTGFYGSARTKDTATLANEYDTSPTTTSSSLLTYTSPSVKMCMGPAGTLRYGAHNLFLNSASPANQSVTVVSGATYSIILTGSVTTTLSGAATGTITAGTTNITAATTTLTFGSTSGSGTVQVTRTPADTTYLATAGSIRYALPLEWSSAGVLQGVLVEEERTNLCLWNRNFTNAAWTKSNVTAAKTATGPDGVTNSASTLTATAGNGTVLQSITSASAARISSAYIKRRTGSGTIEMTQDNGTTWTAVTVTSDWTRVQIPSATVTNPIVGFRIVTSGDAIDVDLFQQTLGAFITSPIETFASTVTRAADNISLSTGAFPYVTATSTVYVETGNGPLNDSGRILSLDGGGLRYLDLYRIISNTARTFNVHTGGSANVDSASNVDWTGTTKLAVRVANNNFAVYSNGSAGGTDTSITIDVAATSLILGSWPAGSNGGVFYMRKMMYLPRAQSNAELVTLTT